MRQQAAKHRKHDKGDEKHDQAAAAARDVSWAEKEQKQRNQKQMHKSPRPMMMSSLVDDVRRRARRWQRCRCRLEYPALLDALGRPHA
jgi:hypothetical protein